MRFAADQYDIAPVLFCIMLDMIHDTSIVEMNGDDLLVDDVLREEGQFLGLSADVVPDLVIEGADRRGCAERLGDGLAGGFPRLDLRKLGIGRQVAAVGDTRSAGHESCCPRSEEHSAE